MVSQKTAHKYGKVHGKSKYMGQWDFPSALSTKDDLHSACSVRDVVKKAEVKNPLSVHVIAIEHSRIGLSV